MYSHRPFKKADYIVGGLIVWMYRREILWCAYWTWKITVMCFRAIIFLDIDRKEILK